jgi:hypothetical protein
MLITCSPTTSYVRTLVLITSLMDGGGVKIGSVGTDLHMHEWNGLNSKQHRLGCHPQQIVASFSVILFPILCMLLFMVVGHVTVCVTTHILTLFFFYWCHLFFFVTFDRLFLFKIFIQILYIIFKLYLVIK